MKTVFTLLLFFLISTSLPLHSAAEQPAPIEQPTHYRERLPEILMVAGTAAYACYVANFLIKSGLLNDVYPHKEIIFKAIIFTAYLLLNRAAIYYQLKNPQLNSIKNLIVFGGSTLIAVHLLFSQPKPQQP